MNEMLIDNYLTDEREIGEVHDKVAKNIANMINNEPTGLRDTDDMKYHMEEDDLEALLNSHNDRRDALDNGETTHPS